MKEYAHLKTYDLVLTTRSPVFVGSGREYNKKEYYYDMPGRKVCFIDFSAMFQLLYSRDLINEYENYILKQSNTSLHHFFRDIKLTQADIEKITEYTADVSDALVEGKPLAKIQQFMRDAQHRPYIPGSSIKGCLRTAILWKLIRSNPLSFDGVGKTKILEKQYLNILNLNKRNEKDEVNSIMRGISISDSLSIDNRRMILTKKDDISTTGKKNTINIIREAVAPGTRIKFSMTIDESVKSNVDADFIRESIREYGQYYKETFADSFQNPENCEVEGFHDCIVLGGGSGYFGKNILYPLYGKKIAVGKVANIMQGRMYSANHHHEKDISLGISPHMIKHTQYKAKSYHYGVCQVEIV